MLNYGHLSIQTLQTTVTVYAQQSRGLNHAHTRVRAVRSVLSFKVVELQQRQLHDTAAMPP